MLGGTMPQSSQCEVTVFSLNRSAGYLFFFFWGQTQNKTYHVTILSSECTYIYSEWILHTSQFLWQHRLLADSTSLVTAVLCSLDCPNLPFCNFAIVVFYFSKMSSLFILVTVYYRVLSFFTTESYPLCVCHVLPVHWWTFRLLPSFGHCG